MGLEPISKIPFLLQSRHFGCAFVASPRRIFPIYAFVVAPRLARNGEISRRKAFLRRVLARKFLPLVGAILFLPGIVFAQDFTRNLYFGLRNDPEVVRLQEFLRGLGYFTYPVSTGNYFTITLEAVKKFQKENGVTPLGGYFGPRSREVANRQLGERKLPGMVSLPTPYKSQIAIGYVSGYATTPESESITIENRSAKENINITGFSIENSKGERFVVPKGYELPGFSAIPYDQIILKAGERAIINVGKQERRTDFRVNLCTGYFAESSNFVPALSHQCPRPDTRQLVYLSDRCLRLLDSTPTCRTVSSQELLDSSCSQYINEHLNYVGCVKDYRSRPDFYSKEWMIWMQRDGEFFRNVRETVILRDPEGREVDRYSY